MKIESPPPLPSPIKGRGIKMEIPPPSKGEGVTQVVPSPLGGGSYLVGPLSPLGERDRVRGYFQVKEQ